MGFSNEDLQNLEKASKFGTLYHLQSQGKAERVNTF